MGISLSELVRRALDKFIDDKVDDGILIRFTWSAAGKSIDMETPADRFKKLYDYVLAHPEGALTVVEDQS